MSLIVRPARVEDVKLFYPDIGATFRAWVAEVDGVVEGIIGLVMTRPVACLISSVSETLRPYLKRLSILRAIKRVQALCEDYRGRIVAVQEPDEPSSPAILHRLGFKPYGRVDGDFFYEFGG